MGLLSFFILCGSVGLLAACVGFSPAALKGWAEVAEGEVVPLFMRATVRAGLTGGLLTAAAFAVGTLGNVELALLLSLAGVGCGVLLVPLLAYADLVRMGLPEGVSEVLPRLRAS